MTDGIGFIDASDWAPTHEELTWYEAEGLLTISGDPADPVYHFRCVRSGSCCRTNLCERGVPAADPTQYCRYLEVAARLSDGSRLYRCTLPAGATDPARQLGKGCCYPWSPERRALIDNFRNKNNDLIPILGLG